MGSQRQAARALGVNETAIRNYLKSGKPLKGIWLISRKTSSFQPFVLGGVIGSNSIKDYFKVGKVYTDTRGITRFRLTQKDEILNKIITHFENYPLQGRKTLQYSTWIQIVNILATEQVRTLERDSKVEKLIKELSSL